MKGLAYIFNRVFPIFLVVFAVGCGFFSTFMTVFCQSSKTARTAIEMRELSPQRYLIKPSDLPKPFETESAVRPSKIISAENVAFYAPKGFRVSVFAKDFERPRMTALAPNGDVFVVDSSAGKVFVLRDKNGDFVIDERFTFLENLAQPFGIAFHKNWLYIANTDAVWRFQYKDGQTKASDKGEKIIELGEGGYNQHWTRNIVFSKDGTKFFVSFGSSGNYQPEKDERRAAISVYDENGKNGRVYASGLRNPVGLAINPLNGELWTAVNERDGLGDNLVPDFVTSVREGASYGYPFSYIGANPEPRLVKDYPEKVAEAVKNAVVPDVLLTSHSAALGIAFNNGRMFPDEYRNDAFVALHGSWNREKLSGYKIIRIKFDKNGKPLGGYEDFLKGFLPDENGREAFGRPVGVMFLKDGSMLITDDGADCIWRVTYDAPSKKSK